MNKIRNTWVQTSILIITETSTVRKVEQLYQSYVHVNKVKNKNNFDKVIKFRDNFDSQLFDLSICNTNKTEKEQRSDTKRNKRTNGEKSERKR